MNPEAVFDALAIIARAERELGPVMRGEVHLFSYLSCLLSVYHGEPASEWGYTFVSTPEGSPFAADLSLALDALTTTSDLAVDGGAFSLTDAGRLEHELLSQIATNGCRAKYLGGACASLLAFPVGILRSTLRREPALQRTSKLNGSRELLDRIDQDQLYEHFRALSQVLGEGI